jgi:hypothetical protein
MNERKRGYNPKKNIVVEGCELFPTRGARLARLSEPVAKTSKCR